jgi:hypothetical protein
LNGTAMLDCVVAFLLITQPSLTNIVDDLPRRPKQNNAENLAYTTGWLQLHWQKIVAHLQHITKIVTKILQD